MFKYIFIALCAFALGVLLRDQAEDYRPLLKAQSVRLDEPVRCDAVIEQRTKPTEAWKRKCYIAGMRK